MKSEMNIGPTTMLPESEINREREKGREKERERISRFNFLIPSAK